MEVREEASIGMPRNMGYNNPTNLLNQESAAKLLPSASITNQTLNPPNLTVQHLEDRHTRDDDGGDGKASPADADPAAPLTATPSNYKLPRPSQTAATPSLTANAYPIRYRECLKNHAASVGGYVIDGCGEFMPSGGEGTMEALKCAACECHRNFHRKQVEGEQQTTTSYPAYHHRHLNRSNHIPHHTTRHHPSIPHVFSTSPPAGPTAPIMMAFGGGGGPAESSSEDLNMFQSNTTATQPSNSMSKKRFRTKFSQEQKEKMHEYAEKLGWKIQKQDEQLVQQFCDEVGLRRQVFKVWMHNNKQAMKKKQM